MDAALEVIGEVGVIGAVLIAWVDTRKRLDRCQAELSDTHRDIRRAIKAWSA